ncbi:hypothetical protein L6Q96_17275 [Candidatus Binatia bacterium]|nr:hypothetical protein [Candidatus Binatia bacterium]
MSNTKIIHRDRNTPFRRPTTARHTFVLRRFVVKVIELEGLHFHHNSAVLLPVQPEGTAADRAEVTPSQVLAACLAHAEEFRDERLVVTGHADTSGRQAYNVTLSEQRSQCIVALLVGGDEGKRNFVRIAKARHKVEDYQRILEFIAVTEGFDCDPHGVDGDHGSDTTTAIRNFQQAFNDAEIGPHIAVNGRLTDETWGAFFEMYQRDIRRALGEDPNDPAALDELRSHLTFFDADRRGVGCGEHFPIENRGLDGFRSAENRRSELCFLPPGNDPDLTGDHPGPGRCNPALCELNDPDIFVPTIIPVEPERLRRIEVHLRLRYKDPQAGKPDHPFPKDLPVTVRFGDGSTQDVTLGPDGNLDLAVRRGKRSLMLVFHYDQPHYVGSAGPTTPAAEPRDKFAPRDDLGTLIVPGFRTFLLPPDLDLKNADWQGLPPTDSSTGGILLGSTSIGTTAAPVTLVLDPHWQYLKLLYFDRKLKRKLSIPPVMMEAFERDVTTPALSQSDWLTDPSGCQALPWILCRDVAGQALGKPDENVVLRFRSTPGTFIDSSANTVGGRKLVTKEVDFLNSTHDPLVSEGDPVSRDFDVPSVARLAFYDLPGEWRSKEYFCKVGGSASAPPRRADFYERVARETTTEDAPLIFSLDDLVLLDDQPAPVDLSMSSGGELSASRRVTVFWHRFEEDQGRSVSPLGIYKADSSAPWWSLAELQIGPQRNYIADYPDWVRLVIARGRGFDVFDQRTAGVPSGPMGARAAVAWVNQPALVNVPSVVTRKPFYAVEAPFRQIYCDNRRFPTGSFDFHKGDNGITVAPTVDRDDIGRLDLIHLRCCDADGNVERVTQIQFVRMLFDFANAPDAMKNSAAEQRKVARKILSNVMKRWNARHPGTGAAEDAQLNPGPPRIETASGAPFAGPLFALFQLVEPQPQSVNPHFTIDIQEGKESDRSFMRSNGTGTWFLKNGSILEPKENGRYTAGHEMGHGLSLPDCYGEVWSNCSLGAASFEYNEVPADIYAIDELSMMVANRQVRPRHYWHVAEWLNALYDRPFRLRHGTTAYSLPHTKGKRNVGFESLRDTAVYWPLRAAVATSGLPGQLNRSEQFLFMFGPGDPIRDKIRTGSSFDGILAVVIRIGVRFVTANDFDTGDMEDMISEIDAELRSRFNGKFRVNNVTVDGQTLSRVGVRFSFRYLCETLSATSDDRRKRYLAGLDKRTATGARASGAVTTAAEYNTTVTGLRARFPPQLNIEVHTSGSSSRNGIDIRLDNGDADEVPKFLAQVLGIPTTGNWPRPDSLVPLIKLIIPNILPPQVAAM